MVWLDFGVTKGREQAGRRPALILSPLDYNRATELAIACPITNTVRGFPFEVALPDKLPITGAVLCDQLNSVSYSERHAEHIAVAPANVLAEVLGKVSTLLL